MYRPKFESWCRAHAGTYPVFQEREELYQYLNQTVLQNAPITYLEFGVFEGASIKRFSELNSSPDSRFVGFDTFTGLPEDWVEVARTVKSGTFSTGGSVPDIRDNRVSFVKGLFQDTLATFLKGYQGPQQWVLHNDSDLYSATLFVLASAHSHLVKGTIVIFDEFCSPMHEFRAFDDYCSSYRRTAEVLAITEGFGKVAVRFN
jgi:O-methyltransferase